MRIARTELLRTLGRRPPQRLTDAEDLLDDLLDDGAAQLQLALEVLVTYDRRMIDAGRAAGMRVVSPGDGAA